MRYFERANIVDIYQNRLIFETIFIYFSVSFFFEIELIKIFFNQLI